MGSFTRKGMGIALDTSHGYAYARTCWPELLPFDLCRYCFYGLSAVFPQTCWERTYVHD